MAVSHVFTTPIADVTGTATVWNGATTASVAASDIVKPSDWNAAHNQFVTISGNTAGNSTVSGTNIVFQGGNNVTLSGTGSTIIWSGPTAAGTGFTSTTTGGTAVVGTLGTNGLSVGVPAFITTFQNDLTSGRAGTGVTTTTTAGANLVGTNDTNGLSLGVPVWLTTAAQSNHSHNFATTTTNGSLIVVATTNSAGATIAVPSYLTTARASNDAIGLNSAFTAGPLAMTINSSGLSLNASSAAGTTSGFAGNLISGSMTHNTAGLNLSLNHPAWLTTARGSTDAVGLNTAQTNVTWTVNSSGLSINAAGYAGTGTTFAGTNVSASATLNSAGLNLALSGQGGGVINQTGPNIAAGTQTATSGTVVFSNSNGVTFGMSNSSVITASVAAGGATISGYVEPLMDREMIGGQIGQNSIYFQPLRIREAIAYQSIVFPINYSNASNSSNSATLSLTVGIYTRNGNSLSLASSTSSSWAVTNSGTVGSYSIYGGPRLFPISSANTLTAGNYWLAVGSRTTTGGGAGMSWSNYVGSNINSAYSGFWSSANNATNQLMLGMGSFSTTTTAMPDSVAFTQIQGSAAVAFRPILFQMAFSTT